jgi:iron(III) transport system substrate-binding protein
MSSSRRDGRHRFPAGHGSNAGRPAGRDAAGRRAGRRITALVGIAGIVGAVLSGCGLTHSGNGLTLYSGQHQQTTDAIVAAFEKATGISVSVRSADESSLANQIVSEGARSPADLMLAENSPTLEYLQEKGLLAPVTSSTLSEVPARFDSPQGDWVGVSARYSALVYNPHLIARSALPSSILELGDPRYAGKLAIAPSETDFQPVVTSVTRAYGRQRTVAWLRALKANAGQHSYPDNETVVNDVNRGTVAFGLIDQYYWYRLRAEIGTSATHSALASFRPVDPGYVLDVSGAAVLKSSRHQAEAQRFLAFLVSPTAQSIIAHSLSFEYPIASAPHAEPAEPPFSSLQPNPISIGELGDGSGAVTLLREAGLL